MVHATQRDHGRFRNLYGTSLRYFAVRIFDLVHNLRRRPERGHGGRCSAAHCIISARCHERGVSPRSAERKGARQRSSSALGQRPRD